MASAIVLVTVAQAQTADRLRFATFNTSLHRDRAGQLVEELALPISDQPRRVAETIQRIRPDVLLLNEFDYDDEGRAAELFQTNFLAVSRNGQLPIRYAHVYLGPVNTGVPTGHDLDNDGRNNGPADAFGYGRHPGQYGMLVLSRLPIDRDKVRTFQEFLWKDMPCAVLPVDPRTGQSFYTPEELADLRLSSKSHWDIPLRAGNRTIHFLVSHPTPPAFDGPEDRNGCRNHDEIRLWADYIDPQRSTYIYDDRGRRGGLCEGSLFVIAGDLNADPVDGGGTLRSITQLLAHPLINASPCPASAGGRECARRQGGANDHQQGDPAHDTADFNDRAPGNLRVDYVLPSRTLAPIDGGIFWPRADQETSRLLEASDHRLVWIDVQ